MTIHEYYFNEVNETLSVEFSTEEDGDNFYRVIKLNLNEIEYYNPTIIESNIIKDMDEDFIKDILNEYLKENDIPEPLSL